MIYSVFPKKKTKKTNQKTPPNAAIPGVKEWKCFPAEVVRESTNKVGGVSSWQEIRKGKLVAN